MLKEILCRCMDAMGFILYFIQ